MSDKHTPGPWKDYGDCVGSRNGGICNLIYEMEHNSALIAAAPTMLEALEALLKAKRWKDEVGKDEYYAVAKLEAWKKAKAAVKAAKGEA